MTLRSSFRHLQAIAIGGCVGAVLLACSVSGPGSADVSCTGAGTSILCDVTHTEGSDSLEVCWDMTLTCANGGTGSGSGFCQTVAPAQTQQKSIPLSDFSGLETCDSVTGMTIINQSATPL